AVSAEGRGTAVAVAPRAGAPRGPAAAPGAASTGGRRTRTADDRRARRGRPSRAGPRPGPADCSGTGPVSSVRPLGQPCTEPQPTVRDGTSWTHVAAAAGAHDRGAVPGDGLRGRAA